VNALKIAIVLLGAALAAQEPAAPDPKLVLAQLQQALANKEPAIAVDAVQRLGRTADDEVVKLLAKTLQHKEAEVQRAALQALRFNPQPSALTALLAANLEQLLDDDDTAAEFYFALGQKADQKALPLLSKGLRVDKGSKVVRARILAIGRIRSPQAVEELMRLLKSGGGGGKNGRGNNPHMADLRVALAALTGEDFGNDDSAWIHWWGEHDEGYRLPKSVELQKQVARQWDSLWTEAPKDRPARGRRGK
jgi:HEAT repeat protein